MKKLMHLKCNPYNFVECTKQITHAIDNNYWIQLSTAQGNRIDIPNHLLPKEAGVVISSGGSIQGPHHCLQPFSHLDQSAISTGQWLKKIGLEPKDCQIFNPLPLHHVSGLMPWWRSKHWGAKHHWLIPSLMRNPIELEKSYKSLFNKNISPLILSLVPTQLQRLINSSAGLRWLQSFDVIWLGGSGLSDTLAIQARSKKIRLAPCYGSTETAAMVTVLTPKAFLAGEQNCGNPLEDVELRLNKNGALEVRTQRVASARWKDGYLESLHSSDGWWQSGDLAKLITDDSLLKLEIHGRLDTAINSGGETIFPEKLEFKIIEFARKNKLQVQSIIFLPINNEEWGQKLVGLIRWQEKLPRNQQKKQLTEIEEAIKSWLPAERPSEWKECPHLEQNSEGKWERVKWKKWLEKVQNT